MVLAGVGNREGVGFDEPPLAGMLVFVGCGVLPAAWVGLGVTVGNAVPDEPGTASTAS